MTNIMDKTNKKGRSTFQDPNKIDKAGRTKIFYYTSSGSLDKVKELVERGANVNHKDHAGWTPLHEAAIKGQYDVAKYLIEQGAIVNARGFEDDTPLHDACSYGFVDCVQLLVDSGANVYALNSEKQTPLDVCEDEDCIRILKAKMKEVDEIVSIDDQGQTILHRACTDGSFEKVKELLSIGANVNARDSSQSTPLHCAARYGHLSLVDLLIKNGADINSVDHHHSTALHLASQHSHQAIVQYLINAGADVHIQDENNHTAYQVSDSVVIRQIITAHIDQENRLRATTEAIDEITFVSNTKHKRIKEDTVLSREERKIQAIMKSFEKAEKSQQLKKTKKDKSSTTPPPPPPPPPSKKRKIASKQASRECSVDDDTPKKKPMVDLVKLDKKDNLGYTQLHKFAMRGYVEAVEQLLKAGANSCERDNAGYTPLHEAALRGKTDIVRLLLEYNADVNSRGADLDTPLHDAAENGHTEVVQLLLEYGADVTIANSKGQTPLDIAIERDDSIADILRQHKPTKPKRRRLVLAANMACKQPESPVSPTSFELKTEISVKDAKAHARQRSGQHLPKKSLKNLQIVKTEMPVDGYQPLIPTPPPDHWTKVIKKEEEMMCLYDDNKTYYPSIHCASKFLPLYTIQQPEGEHSSSFYVTDVQVSLLLGISTEQLLRQYPHLSRRKASDKEKERLWSPLSPMICFNVSINEDKASDCSSKTKEIEKQRFLKQDLYFVRLDQVVSIIKNDYSHLSEILITITLDIGYNSTTANEVDVNRKMNTIKLPPKFAMKMQKCRMLKFDNSKNNHTP
ncbi:hypothetical protein RMCBS344292_13395 [Rhizopus microsporus]|nr:hypothetical protein RMCBS344292_13395 [Rhizopus microsporus]